MKDIITAAEEEEVKASKTKEVIKSEGSVRR